MTEHNGYCEEAVNSIDRNTEAFRKKGRNRLRHPW